MPQRFAQIAKEYVKQGLPKKPSSLPVGFKDTREGELEEFNLLMTLDWDEVTPNHWRKCGNLWFYFDCAYIAYYLPSIIRLESLEPGGNQWVDFYVLSELETQKFGRSSDHYHLKRWSLLSVSQINSVQEWAALMSNDVGCDMKVIKRNLDILRSYQKPNGK